MNCAPHHPRLLRWFVYVIVASKRHKSDGVPMVMYVNRSSLNPLSGVSSYILFLKEGTRLRWSSPELVIA